MSRGHPLKVPTGGGPAIDCARAELAVTDTRRTSPTTRTRIVERSLRPEQHTSGVIPGNTGPDEPRS